MAEKIKLFIQVTSIVEDLIKLKLDPELEREIQYYYIIYILCSGFLFVCGSSFIARNMYKFFRGSFNNRTRSNRNTNLTFF